MTTTESYLITWYKNKIITEALKIAINSLEYDGEHRLAGEMTRLLNSMEKESN